MKTENPLILYKKIELDLSPLYNEFSWKSSADQILKSILLHIDRDKSDYEIKLMINESEDVGALIIINNTPWSDEELYQSLEQYDTEELLEALILTFANDPNNILVKLFDGYETVYAWIEKK